MATPLYTYSQLKSRINAGIKGKIGILIDARETINQVVREVTSAIDLVSARRSTAMIPNLFTGPNEYAAPADIKNGGIIGINTQTNVKQTKYDLVTPQEFNQRQDRNTIAFDDADFIKKILVNASVNDLNITLAALDSITSGGGTWAVSSTGATNLVADSDDYVRENASLSFDISAIAGQTTAGIKNTTLNAFDLTNYLGGNGAVFVWAYITSITGLTNYILKIGNDASNYYPITVTAASDGTAFKTGWNLLRFDLTSLTATGTVAPTTCRYVELYMTKLTSKVSETKYRFDGLYLRKGVKNNLIYYSKYGWMNSSGTYIENSTADSDLLLADTDEFNLFVAKGVELAGYEVDEINIIGRGKYAANSATTRYDSQKKQYTTQNPSDSLVMTVTVADFIRQ